ncbi:MAG: hypothetical protein U9P50_00925 [Patescibacteria group bacterium]|nr:hypothetical protein [Patescibacteria group bacterium]
MESQSNSKQKIEIIKKNGSKQRDDVKLSLLIVSTLMDLILSGKTIYPKEGFISHIYIDDKGEEKVEKISVNTIMMWIKRNNIIPETGEVLRDVLDKKRKVYSTDRLEKRRKKLLDDADREIKRTLNIRSNVCVRDNSGNKVIDKDTGGFVRTENPQLLKIKVDTAKFVKERLDPKNWGKIEKKEVKNMSPFSLADLRKAKREKDGIYTGNEA